MVRAYAPYLVIIVIFSISNIPAVVDFLGKPPFTHVFDWPGLDIVNSAGDPVATQFSSTGCRPPAPCSWSPG